MTEPDNPFEQLAATGDHVVDALFAARLRARVQRALGSTPERITIDLATRTPSGAQRTIEPDRSTTMTQVITPYLCVHDADAALDWCREFFGATVSNVIQVAAVEQFVDRATSGGAAVQRPIEEAHGSRSAWIIDPFGRRWNVGTPVYDAEQVAARRAPSKPYYMTLTTPDVERGAAFTQRCSVGTFMIRAMTVAMSRTPRCRSGCEEPRTRSAIPSPARSRCGSLPATSTTPSNGFASPGARWSS